MVGPALLQALHNLTNPGLLLYMGAAIIIGLFIGVLPAIGGLVPMAMTLPFVFWMTPLQALPFIAIIAAVSSTGGAMTSILLNIPGDEVNAATIIDGYPMTKKGEAGRAIGAALVSSAFGGATAVIISLVAIPMLLGIVMAFRSAEMVFVILLGISFVAGLGERSMAKNLISGLLGILIALIGFQNVTGTPRFTFGSTYLYSGIGLVPVIVGLFALPEAIDLAATGGTIAGGEMNIGRIEALVSGVRDVVGHWWLWLRCTVIGWGVGVIPGIGGIVAAFVSYGHARSSSKHPEKFGTGCIEGVIAPQSGLNAVQGGSMLTTLALGVPGSAGMVIILGAFVLLGLVPGPRMLTEHLDLSLTLLLVIFISNLIAGAICFAIIPYVTKIVIVPARIMFPSLVVLGLTGSFLYAEQIADVLMAVIFTFLGVAMRKFGYSRPAFLLGFVLGGLFEKYFFIAYAADGPLFFVRPICLLLILITLTPLIYGPVKRLFAKQVEEDV
jgi:putative tricarboxylic transport membrane protein